MKMDVEELERRLNTIKENLHLNNQIDVLTFLEEFAYTYNNSDVRRGFMTSGEEIKTDYVYVIEMIWEIESVLLARLEKEEDEDENRSN